MCTGRTANGGVISTPDRRDDKARDSDRFPEVVRARRVPIAKAAPKCHER